MEENKKHYNQRTIRILKALTDYAHPYVKVNIGARTEARSNLSGSAFKLYDYLCCSKAGRLYLSCKHFLDSSGISENSYHSAFHELESKGYLCKDPVSDDPDCFIFCERGSIVA